MTRRTALLVEDHALVAASLSSALDQVGVRLVTIEPAPASTIVSLAAQHDSTLVLLDLDLGREHCGLDLIRPLRAAGLRVVILSGCEDPVTIAAAIEAGAAGFVSKRSAFHDLVQAIERAIAGRELLHPTERSRLSSRLHRARRQDRAINARFARLTLREQQVLAGLCDGLSAAQIAEQSVVAVSTVRSHIRGILTKLEVNRQSAAVALAREAGFDRVERRDVPTG